MKGEGWTWRWKMTAVASSRTRLCVGARHRPVGDVTSCCRGEKEIFVGLPDGGVVVEENGPWWRWRRQQQWDRKEAVHHHKVIDEAPTPLRQLCEYAEKDGDRGNH